MKKIKPSDLQMQILSVLWDKGPSTARQVLETMPDGKTRAYTSILSVMQVMEKNGLLTHTSRGTAHVYRPAANRNSIVRPFMQKVVAEIFGGRPAAAMQALVDETGVSEQDLAQMREILENIKPSRKKRSK